MNSNCFQYFVLINGNWSFARLAWDLNTISVLKGIYSSCWCPHHSLSNSVGFFAVCFLVLCVPHRHLFFTSSEAFQISVSMYHPQACSLMKILQFYSQAKKTYPFIKTKHEPWYACLYAYGFVGMRSIMGKLNESCLDAEFVTMLVPDHLG